MAECTGAGERSETKRERERHAQDGRACGDGHAHEAGPRC